MGRGRGEVKGQLNKGLFGHVSLGQGGQEVAQQYPTLEVRTSYPHQCSVSFKHTHTQVTLCALTMYVDQRQALALGEGAQN